CRPLSLFLDPPCKSPRIFHHITTICRWIFLFIFPNMLTNIYVYVILNSQDKHTRREKIKNVYEKENGYGEVFG
ncbi:hypothetical protein, partial [Hungatella effluvii]|uniref:hypothetical protein n=1 Tax=Hungatella effluvii TaxID=1096246 RepID=UPI002A7F86DE